MHLHQSSQNPQLITKSTHPNITVVSLRSLLKNPSIGISVETFHCPIRALGTVVGACNGLLCLLFKSILITHVEYQFYVWNPATRTISEKLGFFRDKKRLEDTFNFNFGFDYLTGTYKLVALYAKRNKGIVNEGLWVSKVKFFNLGDNYWRNILSFPWVPLPENEGVHLSGTINWLSIPGGYGTIYVDEIFKASITHVDQFVIVSVDLSTETDTRLLLPTGFDEVPYVEPSLRVLMDCLCFSHDYKKTEFVIWQMREFGVQESWTQLFRIEYLHLQRHIPFSDYFLDYMEADIPLLPLYLFKNEDTLMLRHNGDNGIIIYNMRDKTAEMIGLSRYWYCPFDYVESLNSTPWN